ncbi:MAG TPA: TonB-dependent receptor [Flavitalea sp.]|nr:TonB-dependent receptor [Flavitalea sp.]
MNFKLALSVLLLTLSALVTRINAQGKITASSIKGLVVDSAASTPLSNITIKLFTSSATIGKVVITGADGSFNFTDLEEGNYRIRIESVGYELLSIDVPVKGETVVNTGPLKLIPKANQLKAVEVIGNRPVIRQEVDKLVYDLQADPESKSNSVLEMMRKVPFLSLDAEGNVLLNGSRDYKIFLNGKPSAMMERSARDVLKNIPASTIKSIEVIPSPGAKYDAEGLAGIINIITHKKIDNGYNGSINVNYKSPVGGPGMGASGSWKSGRLGFAAFGGLSRTEFPVTNNSFKQISSGYNPSILDQQVSKESLSKNAYFGAELSYEIDSLQLISGQFNISNFTQNGNGQQGTVILTPTEISQAYNLDNLESGNGASSDLALNYQLGFKKSKERLLTFSYRYSEQQNKQFNQVDIYNSFQYDSTDYAQSNAGSFAEHTAQVDYVHPLKKGQLEVGIKSIFRSNYSDYGRSTLDDLTGKYEPVETETNDYYNDQDVLAGYTSYKHNWKSWTVKGGLRLEKTFIDADFLSTSTQLSKQYTSVIPSFAINRKVNNNVNLTLSYSNRVRRPTIFQLNPFVDRSNPQFESSGNPNLKPAYTDIIQLGYSRVKKSTINVAFGAMFFRNIIGTITTYDDSTKISRSTYENMGDGRILKTNIFINIPVSPKWNFTVNADIRHLHFTGQIEQEMVESSGFNTYLNMTIGYRFDKGLRLNAGFTYNSGGFAGPQSTVNANNSSYLSASKDFFKDKLNLSISLTDPWKKYRTSREELGGHDFIQVRNTQFYYRSYSISLNYRFGKLKEGVKKNRRGISNDDTSN